MSIFQFCCVMLTGLLIGLVSLELDDEGNLCFGYQGIIWGFFATSAIGGLAGGSLGRLTVQISGGRDPEYETHDIRSVDDATRWRVAEDIGGRAFLPIALGLLAAYGVVTYYKWRGRTFDKSEYNKVRMNAGIFLVMLFFVVLLRSFEG